MFKKYLLNIAISIDQLLNTFLGGDPDEVYSSRLGKIKKKHGGKIPWSRPVCRIIDAGLEVIDPNHSVDAIEADEGKDAIVDK